MTKDEILRQYSTDELKAEIKRRNVETKKAQESVIRCRTCAYYGIIDYWGNATEHGKSRGCPFKKTKNGKYYRVLFPYTHACEKYQTFKQAMEGE